MMTRRFSGLLVTMPLAVVIGAQTVSWALSLKNWTPGETLTAADLNGNFTKINNDLGRLDDVTTASDTGVLRASRRLSLPAGATRIGLGDGWTDVSEGIYGFAPEPALLPGTERRYRLTIRSGNNCIPVEGDVVKYRLFFFWPHGGNNHPDTVEYTGRLYWGEVAEGGWEVIDLDHVLDPAGGTRPEFWKLQALATGCSHLVKDVQADLYDVAL
jgi:hypothetical protein